MLRDCRAAALIDQLIYQIQLSSSSDQYDEVLNSVLFPNVETRETRETNSRMRATEEEQHNRMRATE